MPEKVLSGNERRVRLEFKPSVPETLSATIPFSLAGWVSASK